MKTPLKVLLLDTTQYQPSSPMFAEALARFSREGEVVGSFIDEGPTLSRLSTSLIRRFVRRVRPGFDKSLRALHRTIAAEVNQQRPDVILVVKGAHLSLECVRAMKATGATLVNFTTDDPFNRRTSSASWLRTLPMYDLICSPRRANIDELRSLGPARVEFVPFGYKPDLHFPETPQDSTESDRFQSDVCFIGGADSDRHVYFEALVSEMPDVKLALYGGYWNRSRHLARFWRGFAVGRDFRLAVGGATVSVNLVRRANRDDHVMRTFELAACGACMLIETTSVHRELFEDSTEAFFFDSPTTFVNQIRSILSAPAQRRVVAEAAWKKIIRGGHRYDDRLQTILQLALETRLKTSLRHGVSVS